MSESLSLRQCAFTHAVALLILEAKRLGYAVKVQEWNRDLETQKKYVAEGKSKTLESAHLLKLAVDIVLFQGGVAVWTPEAYLPLGEYWESLGGVWGGRFGVKEPGKIGWDPVHFEFKQA